MNPLRFLYRRGAAAICASLFLTGSAGAADPTNLCLKLDGRGSYVELPLNLFTNLTRCTVEVWAKWDGFPNFARVLEFGGPWHSFSLFNHTTNTDLRFNLYPRYAKNDPSALQFIRATNVLRTNEWIHIAAVAGGEGGMQLFINGKLAGRHTNTTGLADLGPWQTNLIGRGLVQSVTDQDFRGEIDELRVWDHRRSVEQIRDNMFKRLSRNEPGLAHLWNFDNGNARDLVTQTGKGTLKGRARIGPSDLGLVAVNRPPARKPGVTNSTVAPVAATPTPTNSPVAGTNPAAIVAAATPGLPAAAAAPEARTSVVAWWIAGALTLLVVVLGWLAWMFRRSGLGSARIGAPAHRELLPATIADASAVPAELKERALAELTDFAKQSLVQGLYSQRAALLAAQEQAQRQLVEMESRLATLDLGQRIHAYEERIAELESQLESRDEQVRELTRATLDLLRRRLAEEQRVAAAPRRN